MTGTPPSKAGTARSGPRADVVFRVGWAALLAALVLLSGLEIHPGGEAHDPITALAGGHEDLYFPSASHPAARPHAEEARAASRPPCAACLNRLQGNGAHFAPAASLSTPLAAQPLPSAAAVTPLRKSLRPDGARAPPLA